MEIAFRREDDYCTRFLMLSNLGIYVVADIKNKCLVCDNCGTPKIEARFLYE